MFECLDFDTSVFCCMTYYCDDCIFTARDFKALDDLANWSSDQFFVNLGQLAGNNYLAIACDSGQLVKAGLYSVWCLEEDNNPANSDEPAEP